MKSPHDRQPGQGQEDGRIQELRLVVRSPVLPSFFSLLQKGVGVTSRVGISVKAFLCDDLGLSPEFLDTRVQTVFLNGKAVDDLEAALLYDGAVLALSAAMPGLLGATLRRGSYYAAMRGEISYRGETEALTARPGVVSIKLFNLLVGEIGPALLSRGVRIGGADLGEFLERQPPRFWSGCLRMEVDGQEQDSKTVLGRHWHPEAWMLKVTAAE